MSEEEAKRYFEFLQTIPTPIAVPPNTDIRFDEGYTSGFVAGFHQGFEKGWDKGMYDSQYGVV